MPEASKSANLAYIGPFKVVLFSSSLQVENTLQPTLSPQACEVGITKGSTEAILCIVLISKRSAKSIKSDVLNWQTLQVAAAYTASCISQPKLTQNARCAHAPGHFGERMLLQLRRIERSLSLAVQGAVALPPLLCLGIHPILFLGSFPLSLTSHWCFLPAYSFGKGYRVQKHTRKKKEFTSGHLLTSNVVSSS